MKYLRFSDLVARGIIRNRVTLKRWQEGQGFPLGVKLGPNSRAWPESDIEDWLAKRVTGNVQPPEAA